MAYIQRIAFRHLYSIRHQVVGALGMVFKSMPKYDFIEWLHDSAPKMVSFAHESSGNGSLYFRHDESKKTHVQNYAMLINLCLMAYEAQMSARDASIAAYRANDMISTSQSDHPNEDQYGTELGGSWDVEGFIIRSGIVLTFGAIEEFERGVIRVLLSLGNQGQCRQAPSITARLKDFNAMTSEWAALEKTRKTYSVKGRHELLSSFGLNADIDTEWNRRLKLMRDDRNQIAHGFKALSHPFQTFVSLHYDCFAAVREIARQAKEVQHIVL